MLNTCCTRSVEATTLAVEPPPQDDFRFLISDKTTDGHAWSYAGRRSSLLGHVATSQRVITIPGRTDEKKEHSNWKREPYKRKSGREEMGCNLGNSRGRLDGGASLGAFSSPFIYYKLACTFADGLINSD